MINLIMAYHWRNSGIRGTFNEELYKRILEVKLFNENK